MKVATIAIFCDDLMRLENYKRYVEEYIDDIAMQIIVDNGSVPPLADELKAAFPNAHVISLETNGGVTAANNAGIKLALSNPEIDSIMLLGNDVEIKRGGIPVLYDYLFADPALGMVAPPLLREDGSIESYGFDLSRFLLPQNRYFGKAPKDLPPQRYCDYTPGAACLAKREFYEKTGLQDERLFMYADETDMFLRAKKVGLREGVTARTCGWHRHIPTGKAGVFDFSMIQYRNKAFIFTHKEPWYRGMLYLCSVMFYKSIRWIYHIGRADQRNLYRSFIKGICLGLRGNMDLELCRKM